MSAASSPMLRPDIQRFFSFPAEEATLLRPTIDYEPHPARPGLPASQTLPAPGSHGRGATSQALNSPVGIGSPTTLLSPPLAPSLVEDVPYRAASDDCTSLDQHRRHIARLRNNDNHLEDDTRVDSKQDNRVPTFELEGDENSSRNDKTGENNSIYSHEGASQNKPRTKSIVICDRLARTLISRDARRWSLMGREATPAPAQAIAVAGKSSSSSSGTEISSPSSSLLRQLKQQAGSEHTGKEAHGTSEASAPVVRRDTPATITLRKASKVYGCQNVNAHAQQRRQSKPMNQQTQLGFNEQGLIPFESEDAVQSSTRVRSGSSRPITWDIPQREQPKRRRSSSSGHGVATKPALTLVNIHAYPTTSPPKTRRTSRVEQKIRRLNSTVRINTGYGEQQIIWNRDDSISSWSGSDGSPLRYLADNTAGSTPSIQHPIPVRPESITERLEELAALPEHQAESPDLEDAPETSTSPDYPPKNISRRHTEMFGWMWRGSRDDDSDDTSDSSSDPEAKISSRASPIRKVLDGSEEQRRPEIERRHISFNSSWEPFPSLPKRRGTDDWKISPVTDLNAPLAPLPTPSHPANLKGSRSQPFSPPAFTLSLKLQFSKPTTSSNKITPLNQQLEHRSSRSADPDIGSSSGVKRKSTTLLSQSSLKDAAAALYRPSSPFHLTGRGAVQQDECRTDSAVASLPGTERLASPNSVASEDHLMPAVLSPTGSWPFHRSRNRSIRDIIDDRSSTPPLVTWRKLRKGADSDSEARRTKAVQVAGKDEDDWDDDSENND